MKISIVGTGYVGLVTGVGLASLNHEVICVDIDKKKVKKINQSQSPIYEKDLDLLLKTALDKNLFSATTDLKSAVFNSEITFIAVPTPGKKNNEIDLSFIKKAAKKIGRLLSLKKTYHTIVIKSTVVPETTLKTILPILEKSSGKKAGEFGLCMNPEFLSEGKAVSDFMNPDRIIIGEYDKKSGDHLASAYGVFSADIIRTSLNNAEMMKYASNSFLSTLISFSNEMANICEKVPGADIFEVLKGLYLDKRLNPIINNKRVNPEFLTYIYPGCGFGGSCFPKDVNAIIRFAEKKGYQPKLLQSVLEINEKRAAHFVNLAEKKIKGLKNKKIAVLGLSFKPGTNDIRMSPALSIIKELISKKAHVSVYDPTINLINIEENLRHSNLNFCNSLNETIKGKDACFLITGWEEFKKITPGFLKKEMKKAVLIDGRGFFNSKDFIGKIDYFSIGLGDDVKNIQSS